MHDTSFLTDVLILLIAAVVIVASFRSLKMSPVLGYLVAGAAIGPYGLSIIKEVETTAGIAEIGVVFLLFIIGLELSFERLRDMRRHVFGLGTLQVVLTGGLIAAALHYLAIPLTASMVVGFSLAMSSTAVVLQVVNERGEQASQPGRLSLAVLILQDFAVVPLLVLIPLLAQHHSHDALAGIIALTLFKALIALVLIFILGRLFLRPLFRFIARIGSPELFAATTLLIVLGAAYATHHVGLSLALGAFLAGLLVAETEYEHQVAADIMPFQGLFLGLFFMSVGMSLDIDIILDQYLLIAAMALGLIFFKAGIIILLCRLYRIRTGNAFETGFLLAQGSEFGFILFGMAARESILTAEWAQLMMVIVTLSMALTPLMAGIGRRVGDWLEKNRSGPTQRIGGDTSDLRNHVIIAGFGRRGKMLASLLALDKIPFVAVDMDPRDVSEARKKLLPVYYGDSSRVEVLQAIGADRAQMIIFTYAAPKTLEKAIATARQAFPEVKIVARAPDTMSATHLQELGAHVVVEEALESSLHLGAALLRARGTVESEITRLMDRMRRQHGEMAPRAP